ncbi:hypothetical protein O6H91_Y186100 [Diphasiastrum complanatum]|nr:hypothetical protein O6H91_Y186100 [Diphasiastrum complanatum]
MVSSTLLNACACCNLAKSNLSTKLNGQLWSVFILEEVKPYLVFYPLCQEPPSFLHSSCFDLSPCSIAFVSSLKVMGSSFLVQVLKLLLNPVCLRFCTAHDLSCKNSSWLIYFIR